MPDYSKAKIYKLLNTETNDIYIGSTVEPLCKRMWKHKNSAKRPEKCNYNLYKLMNTIGVDKFSIELHESYPCSSKEELHARENHWIRQLGTLNMAIPGRTWKEWYHDNKETQLQRGRAYQAKNKERIADYQKQYYEEHRSDIKQKHAERILCDCGMYYTYGHKPRHMSSKKHEERMKQKDNPQE